MNNLVPTFIDVSNKGQILIPAKMRKAMGIVPGGKVILYPFAKDEKIIVESVNKDPIEAACGLLASKDKRLWSAELLKERLEDLKKEEK